MLGILRYYMLIAYLCNLVCTCVNIQDALATAGQEDAEELVGKVTSLSTKSQTNSFAITVLNEVSNSQIIIVFISNSFVIELHSYVRTPQ